MPNVIIIAGPNGAGKTTAAPFLLRHAFAVTEFVNADFIAQYERGLQNFFRVYAPLATGWRFYSNRGADGPRLVARGSGKETIEVCGPDIWQLVQKYR